MSSEIFLVASVCTGMVLLGLSIGFVLIKVEGA